MFKIKIWHTGLVHIITTICLIWAIYLIVTGAVHWAYAIPIVVNYYVLCGVGSIGMHKLFVHRSYKTSRPWQIAFALIGTLIVIGSPIQWAVAHTAHHDHSDTPDDPHNATSLRGLWLGNYNKPKKYSFRFARHLLKDPFHVYLHKYALIWVLCFTWVLAWVGVITGIGWWQALVFFYLAPLGWSLWAVAIHNLHSHRLGKGVQDLKWFFWLYIFEWAHKSHHEKPWMYDTAYKYRWLPDPGAWFIRAIKT